MVGERRAAHLHVAGGIDAGPRRGPTGDRQTELITALEQCARGGPGAVEALRLWQDGRIPAMLRRMLGDPARANHTFDRFVADLAGTSGAEHGWSAANAEDWLFSRLRLYARGGGQEPVAQPRLHAVEPVVRQVEAPLPATVTVIAPRVPDNVPADADDAPEIVNPRLRRPSAPLTTRRIAKADRQRPRRRQWPRVLISLLLCLLAAGIGFGLTVSGVAWLTSVTSWLAVEEPAPAPQPSAVTAGEPTPAPAAPGPPVVQTIPPPMPPPSAPPAPAPAAPAPSVVENSPPPAPPPPAPSAREVLGNPLAAREPEIEPLPASQAPTLPVEQAVRVIVHYNAADRDSSEVAGRLAEQLQRAGLGTSEARPVPFRIGATSVRYFRAEDRGRADRLVAAVQPFLSWNGRAAPSTPIDFTDFRPLPRPGTLEIWLPGR